MRRDLELFCRYGYETPMMTLRNKRTDWGTETHNPNYMEERQ